MKERVIIDLTILFSNVNSIDNMKVFQNLLNDCMEFDDYLNTTWGVDIQETPLLCSVIQNSEYFWNWLKVDKEVYLMFLDSVDLKDDVCNMIYSIYNRLFKC